MQTLQRPEQAPQSASSKLEANQLLTLLVCCLSISIIVIDFTIVNNALPSIQATFSGVSVKDLEWITSLYGLLFGSFLLTWENLAVKFGRKPTLVTAMPSSVIGSVITALSATLSQSFEARQFQGSAAPRP